MSMKDEVLELKKELEEVKEESFAMELLKDFKVQNKRLFIVWIITFLTLIGVTCYTIYLLNDIGVIEETTTFEQEVSDIDSVGGNIINKGDVYGENKTDN